MCLVCWSRVRPERPPHRRITQETGAVMMDRGLSLWRCPETALSGQRKAWVCSSSENCLQVEPYFAEYS